MSRYERLLGVAKSATRDRLERCERVIYPYAAKATRTGLLLDSQLERVLRELSERTGVGLRSVNKAYRAVAKANPERLKSVERAGPYRVAEGVIAVEKDIRDGPVSVPLCNFAARIVEERERDDGVERTLTLVLEGRLANGRELPPTEVSASVFGAMNWPVAAWGTKAVVYAGAGARTTSGPPSSCSRARHPAASPTPISAGGRWAGGTSTFTPAARWVRRVQ